jgi:6,7-dimethyl-8-ribityllumazine synthase
MRTSISLQIPAELDPAWRIGIVYSSYYLTETMTMVSAASKLLREAGIKESNITLHQARGAFEIPLIGAQLVHEKKVDALIALGIIVEGETEHARLIAEECARGIMDIQVQHRVPFAFEVLYVNDLKHAKDRATGEANKGEEAALAALHSLAELGRIGS